MYVKERQGTNTYENVRYATNRCSTIHNNRGVSYEKLRMTANNRDKLRKAKTSCEFPIRTLNVVSGAAP